MNVFRIIRKADVILLVILISSSAAMLFFSPSHAAGSAPASVVNITKDGKTYGTYSIYDNKTIDTGSNIIVIENGQVYMKSSDCKNQICVHTGRISRPGQTIICMPNRIAVSIKGGDGSYDAVSR